MDPYRINMDEDDFMAAARLEPDKISFPGKDKLRKSASDLTYMQIEYLSVSCLEKDISPEQTQELEINLRENIESRAIFDAVQKTKLVAPSITYKHKGSLKKLTAGQKAFRIITTGLSAAAAVTILIVSYIFVPDLVKSRDDRIATGIIQDPVTDIILIERKNPIIASAAIPLEEKENDMVAAETITLPVVTPDRLPGSMVTENQSMPYIFVPAAAGIRFQTSEMFLMASNNSFASISPGDDRSRLRKFIAGTFREKLLGEEKPSDHPLEPFEIVLAGVDGLNKFLDWNMELKKITSETGEVNSVYFSSALLTFKSPVKKSSE
jgi:hypothetical protein